MATKPKAAGGRGKKRKKSKPAKGSNPQSVAKSDIKC
jgi:hypothetical protein